MEKHGCGAGHLGGRSGHGANDGWRGGMIRRGSGWGVMQRREEAVADLIKAAEGRESNRVPLLR